MKSSKDHGKRFVGPKKQQFGSSRKPIYSIAITENGSPHKVHTCRSTTVRYGAGVDKRTVLFVFASDLSRRILEKELEGVGVRLNKKQPEITFRKREKGPPAAGSSIFLAQRYVAARSGNDDSFRVAF